jgi:hypothetical protein
LENIPSVFHCVNHFLYRNWFTCQRSFLHLKRNRVQFYQSNIRRDIVPNFNSHYISWNQKLAILRNPFSISFYLTLNCLQIF